MLITALDIGTAKIKALVAEIRESDFYLINAFLKDSAGIKKGEPENKEELTKALALVFEKIKNTNKKALKSIFVNIGGSSINCQTSKGTIVVSRADEKIAKDDIDRVIDASRRIKILPNREIIHSLVKDFVVDGVGDIREPEGLKGTRLEVNSLIIDAFSFNVESILKSIEGLGGKVEALIYNPLAASYSTLTKLQKDLGVILIDIGAATTDISVFEEGKPLYVKTFPIGTLNIVNDLAIGLKCSLDLAKIISLNFGKALAKEVNPREKITPSIFREKTGFEIKDFDKNFKGNISLKFVVSIIEARLREIFELINNELKSIDKEKQLPAGVVLVGSGANIELIVDLAKEELKLPSEIGYPAIKELNFSNFELIKELENPEFATLLGLLFYAKESKKDQLDFDRFDFRKILKYFFP